MNFIFSQYNKFSQQYKIENKDNKYKHETLT